MSTPEPETLDEAFLCLFAHAGPGAAARVAEALTPQERAGILRQRRYALPQGLRDWAAEHGEGGAAGEAGQAGEAGEAEAQWRAVPAGDFRRAGATTAPLPEVERRIRARLGGDEQAWQSAFELLADGFTGDLPALLDAAARHDPAGADPDTPVSPRNEVAWLIRMAPGDLPQRLLRRLAPGARLELASGSTAGPLLQALIDTGDRAVWQRLLGGSYGRQYRSGSREAEFERAFLTRDDPQVNEWLLIGLNSGQPDRGYRLPPSVRLALLEGRPFGPDSADPLPRTPAVHAVIAHGPPSHGWEPDLLRLCYDSREPGLAAHALRVSFHSREQLLTPYQQVVAAIRLWGSGRSGELAALLGETGGADGTTDRRVREALGAALAEHSARPLYDAASAYREQSDDHLDEALRVWGLRLPDGLRPSRLAPYTQAELAAASRAITGDRWYRVDWDLVRRRLADPDVRHHRSRARERYGVLLARADCPPDVVAALTHPDLNGLDLLRLYADRETAVAVLTRCNLGPGHPWNQAQTALGAARPQPGWEPAATPEDVLRYARPVHSLLHVVPRDTVGGAVAEFLREAGIDTPTAEARLWLALRRLTPYFSGSLPQLLRTAARLAEGGTQLDTVPAADLLVGPGREEAAEPVRDRLGTTPGPWAHAVRLLAAAFDGTLPELLDTARAEPPVGPGPDTALRGAPAALLRLAPAGIADAVVSRLDVPARILLARTTRDTDTLRSLVRHGGRPVWDALLDSARVRLPSDPPFRSPYADLRDEVLTPELLAQDDPWLNARLVHEEFVRQSSQDAAHTGAVLAGRPFGPGKGPVRVLPELRADYADWNPDCGAELPKWTRNPYFYTSPEPVLAMQALMTVRKSNYQDPPFTLLDVRQSLLAASTIAHADRFDLLEHVVTHWHVRYPYPEHLDVRDLFGRAVRLRTAEEIDGELSSPQ
ncbi:hypothetical protein [Streptomyces sp. NPDC090445]|uniref:hypothetical protein n=1 Tax=Streptomyces sp. NPDC090445 TaxID=3365963 RepID=UPI003802A158